MIDGGETAEPARQAFRQNGRRAAGCRPGRLLLQGPCGFPALQGGEGFIQCRGPRSAEHLRREPLARIRPASMATRRSKRSASSI